MRDFWIETALNMEAVQDMRRAQQEKDYGRQIRNERAISDRVTDPTGTDVYTKAAEGLASLLLKIDRTGELIEREYPGEGFAYAIVVEGTDSTPEVQRNADANEFWNRIEAVAQRIGDAAIYDSPQD